MTDDNHILPMPVNTLPTRLLKEGQETAGVARFSTGTAYFS
jgi:hypothetical protein